MQTKITHGESPFLSVGPLKVKTVLVALVPTAEKDFLNVTALRARTFFREVSKCDQFCVISP
jgi:hypothetical protein